LVATERFGNSEDEERAKALRDTLIEILRRNAQQLLLTPAVHGSPVAYDIIVSYEQMLVSWEKFAEAISASNPGFWMRDLPKDVGVDYRRAQHAINTLQRIYAPTQTRLATS
jgi:hypothetical protein